MVATIHLGENEEKRNFILEAAQKRFALYGLAKTTMNEIASDLGISKGSLYYYFPDKEHLYAEVIIKEQNIFLQTIDQKVWRKEDPSSMLREYLAIRLDLFRKSLNFSRFRLEEIWDIRPLIGDKILIFKNKEQLIVEKILEEGVLQKMFVIENIKKTAALYLTLLRGLFHAEIRTKNLYYLEQHEFSCLEKDAKLFTSIYLNGLQINKIKISNDKCLERR